MSKVSILVRGFVFLVVMTSAVAVAGSVTFLVASDAILQTGFLGAGSLSYILWAVLGYLVILMMMVKAYSDHFQARLHPDPDLVTLDEFFPQDS